MSQFFTRAYKIRVDEVVIEGNTDANTKIGLDIQFQCHRSLKKEPNTCKVSIFGLSADTRSRLEKRFKEAHGKRTAITCEVEAGYLDHTGVVFRGDLRTLQNTRDGAEWVTTFEAADGGHSFKTARISRSYGRGTPIGVVIEGLVDAMGVGRGNLDDVKPYLKIHGVGSYVPQGWALNGPAEKYMTSLTKGSGYDWSVQGGSLVFQKRNKPVETGVFSLSADAGLIGSPEVVIDATALGAAGKTKPAKSGGVKFRSLMLPRLRPGARINLDSEQIKGTYFIKELTTVGTTFGQEWYSECVGGPVNG